MAPENNGREPIPAAKRSRLQKMFEHASKVAEQGNFEYAINLFSQCVTGDPGNPIYARQMLSTLSKQYNNSAKNVSKLAGIKSTGTRASLQKSKMQKDWAGVIKTGIDVLKGNPWDVATLTSMAQACEEMSLSESQLCYLKMALDVNPKDIEVNRYCGRALARIGAFDQAIACWHRVEQAKPGDNEAQHAIADLAVERVIDRGGYEEAQSATDVRKDAAAADDGAAQLTPEQQLQKKISKQPGEVSLYSELADLHLRNERMEEAEEVLAKALEVSGGDAAIRERLEDVQLRRHRNQVTVAERRAAAEKTPEAIDLAKQMKAELNRVEVEIYRARSDRYPTNLGLKFELGVRLKRARQYQDAIQCLQLARSDTKRKAVVHLELGECFQHLKKYPLALNNYESALESLSERDVDTKKLVLYSAGRLALFMAIHDTTGNEKWLDSAEKYLTDLASLEFVYKDVPALLDKVTEMRNKG
jgi:tetratricopeptide (TPR) repeat protein